MDNRVFLFICGIKTVPAETDNWTGRSTTWVHKFAHENNKLWWAEKIEYYSSALFRPFHHQKRVDKLRSTLDYYRNRNIYITAHSNGASVVLDALKQENWPQIQQLDLISPASKTDMAYIGPRLGREVKKLRIWIAKQDKALKLAKSPIGKLLGYGSLGLDGIKGIPEDIKNKYIEEIIQENYEHSDWFKDENFDKTMQIIINS